MTTSNNNNKPNTFTWIKEEYYTSHDDLLLLSRQLNASNRITLNIYKGSSEFLNDIKNKMPRDWEDERVKFENSVLYQIIPYLQHEYLFCIMVAIQTMCQNEELCSQMDLMFSSPPAYKFNGPESLSTIRSLLLIVSKDFLKYITDEKCRLLVQQCIQELFMYNVKRFTEQDLKYYLDTMSIPSENLDDIFSFFELDWGDDQKTAIRWVFQLPEGCVIADCMNEICQNIQKQPVLFLNRAVDFYAKRILTLSAEKFECALSGYIRLYQLAKLMESHSNNPLASYMTILIEDLRQMASDITYYPDMEKHKTLLSSVFNRPASEKKETKM